MKRFKFELGSSYVYYFGTTMGDAIEAFLKHRPNRLSDITAIIEEPIKDHERP